MNHESKFRYYRVDGSALEILKAYKEELDILVDDRQKLEMEFAERVQQQTDYHQANLRTMWRRMAASVGLDPDKTWGNPEYQIEVRYLDDGFGALLYIPRQLNPMREIIGGEPMVEPQDPALDLPPEGTTRH